MPSSCNLIISMNHSWVLEYYGNRLQF